MPSDSEKRAIKSFAGDVEQLGKAEQYMLKMLSLPDASKRIKCMMFCQQFSARVAEIKMQLNTVTLACDDIKGSDKFRKVLKAILKIGNQINSTGHQEAGFTLESLLSLQTVKTADKKTTVLQYIVTVILRSDPDILAFPEDLTHLYAASRAALEMQSAEITNAKSQCDIQMRAAAGITADAKENEVEGCDAVLSFLMKVSRSVLG